MKNPNFEWLGEDEDSLTGFEKPVLARRKFWKRIGFWMILLFAGLLVVAYMTLDRRQAALEDGEQQNISNSFKLWREAVLNNDVELFSLALAKEDRNWFLTQKKLFDKGLILNREPIGLQVLNNFEIEPEIELSADLQRATLTYMQDYKIAGGGQPIVVRLRQSAIYLKRDDTWQYAVMDDEYWGGWLKEEEKYLTVEYKERDAQIAQKIGRDLNKELEEKCANSGETGGPIFKCSDLDFTLVMSTDPQTIDGFSHPVTSFLEENATLLPTPSLLGIPIDDAGYAVIYEAYANILRQQFQSLAYLPIPLPDEAIYSLCFDFPNEGFGLYRYDARQNTWTSEMPKRAFYSLRSYPDDRGVVLQEVTPPDEGSKLRLVRYQDQQETVLFDNTFERQSYRPIGWGGADSSPRLLLQGGDNQVGVNYGWLDLRSCADHQCEVSGTSGYPIWSPDGLNSLVVDGSSIYTGDAQARKKVLVSEGFNPFWIDRQNFGFIRFAAGDSGLTTELVVASLLDEGLHPILDGRTLNQQANIGEGDNILIQYAATNPHNPNSLILSASGVGKLAGEYFIFNFELPDNYGEDAGGELDLLFRHKGTPGGTPASLTPTGFPPIDISPDGRWLLLSELASDSKSTWSYFFLNTEGNYPPRVTESFPILPAQFPFYDWSKDGQWLVIADYGFFRLVAPEYDYERLVHHDFDSCGFTVWSE